MEFIKRLKDRAPEYLSIYKDLITRFTLIQGGTAGTASEIDKWGQGKYFSTQYEIYMYATILGLKRKYRVPLLGGADKSKFIEMRSWQPVEISEYIIMSVLALSEIDFNTLEDLDEKEVETVLTKLKKDIEEYANGGFDIISARIKDDGSFFENNENCFLDLINESTTD